MLNEEKEKEKNNSLNMKKINLNEASNAELAFNEKNQTNADHFNSETEHNTLLNNFNTMLKNIKKNPNKENILLKNRINSNKNLYLNRNRKSIDSGKYNSAKTQNLNKSLDYSIEDKNDLDAINNNFNNFNFNSFNEFNYKDKNKEADNLKNSKVKELENNKISDLVHKNQQDKIDIKSAESKKQIKEEKLNENFLEIQNINKSLNNDLINGGLYNEEKFRNKLDDKVNNSDINSLNKNYKEENELNTKSNEENQYENKYKDSLLSDSLLDQKQKSEKLIKTEDNIKMENNIKEKIKKHENKKEILTDDTSPNTNKEDNLLNKTNIVDNNKEIVIETYESIEQKITPLTIRLENKDSSTSNSNQNVKFFNLI